MTTREGQCASGPGTTSASSGKTAAKELLDRGPERLRLIDERLVSRFGDQEEAVRSA